MDEWLTRETVKPNKPKIIVLIKNIKKDEPIIILTTYFMLCKKRDFT